ncbi:MAG: hypothetical protein HZB34_09490 [Nitrospirae bacterium]|nr:hypothetical protein [Nitrospirota bacterium]
MNKPEDLEMVPIGWHTDLRAADGKKCLFGSCGLFSWSDSKHEMNQTNQINETKMTSRSSPLLLLFGFLMLGTASTVQADGEILAFAVVSEAPKDKARVAAKVSIHDAVSDMKLLASETILNNLIWKKLEICHAMKLHGFKAAEGFQVVTVHVIDAGMLPMSLQSFAGDCLIKKAIEIVPLVD